MGWRRTTFGALLVIAVTGLVVPTAASPASEAKPRTKTFKVLVARPVRGDANITVVSFRGRLRGRPVLTNRSTLGSSLALAATRRRGGRTEVWLAVLNRGPGATSRKLASRSAASQGGPVRWAFRGEYMPPGGWRTTRHSNVLEWPDEPPAICDEPGNTRNPRPLARWGSELLLPALLDIFLRALCDEILSAEIAAAFGIPHTNFTASLLSPNQIRFSGKISVASTGTLIKHLPAGTYSLRGPDAASCSPGVQGTTHFVRCNARKPAGASLDLILVYRDVLITVAAIALLEAALFDEEGDFYGPYPLVH